MDNKRASAKEMRPVVSKVKSIEEHDIAEEPSNMDTEDRPIPFIDNPLEIIPHNDVPEPIKKAIIQTYGEKFFMEKKWTKIQITRLYKVLSRPRENMSNIAAQICGPNCKMMDKCPYDISGKAPVGERCLVELHYSDILYKEYTIAVSERLKISGKDIKHDIILHNLIMGLVVEDIIELRLNHHIADDGLIIDVPVVVNEQTGEVYTRPDESVAIRMRDRVQKRKDQLFKQLIATPEMAEKYKRKETNDQMAKTASVLEKLDKILEARQISSDTNNE